MRGAFLEVICTRREVGAESGIYIHYQYSME